MSDTEVAPEVVDRRVRNRIIEYLELASSFSAQREYHANMQAKAPYVSVPAEVICEWEGWVREEKLHEWYGPPTYTAEEHEAIVRFQAEWEAVADSTPDPLPDMETTLRLPQWERLRSAAEEALGVFQRRGKLPED